MNAMAQDDFKKAALNLDRLYKAAAIAAELVTRFGDDYWPVFERIDRELEARRSRKSRLEKFTNWPDPREPGGMVSNDLRDEGTDRARRRR